MFVIFVVLMIHVAFGFTMALVGFFLLSRGGDPARISRTLPLNAPEGELPPTAIVMPIFNEDVARVFQALRVMDESLQRTGRAEAFDFFVLSDSTDPNRWIAEEMAWLELCRQARGFGRIFYRNRRVTLHNKSGNVADFCRHWGANYRYMIVLDADSIMTGETFVRLVRLMEQNPRSGIIQTNPQSVLGETLFQRIQQFAGRIYGPLFMAGASVWQHGSGNYWGHNAIIRLKPFIEHCAMPELPKAGTLGTRILSHDTIEAALMRRAGYSVWFAYDLEGSFEESPPNLPASLVRDRRWCRGNLQHLWFLVSRGVKAPNRIHILNGIMAYVGSPLWLFFLLLSTASAVIGEGGGLMPKEQGGPQFASAWLFAAVMTLLLLPKALGVVVLFRSCEKVKALGGRTNVFLSSLAETLFSILLAPILMLFHTRFVFACLAGSNVRWGKQSRIADAAPSWGDCFRTHGANMIFVSVWIGVLVWRAPGFLLWFSPVLAGPLLAVAFDRFIAHKSISLHARERGWFLVPEETVPPVELRLPDAKLSPQPSGEFFRSEPYVGDFGLLQAVLDPYCNAVHVSVLRPRESVTRTQEYVSELGDRLLRAGPNALTAQEKNTLLWDADSMRGLHRRLWRSPACDLHEWWQVAVRHYNESLALSVRRTINAMG